MEKGKHQKYQASCTIGQSGVTRRVNCSIAYAVRPCGRRHFPRSSLESAVNPIVMPVTSWIRRESSGCEMPCKRSMRSDLSRSAAEVRGGRVEPMAKSMHEVLPIGKAHWNRPSAIAGAR